jgi:hypothetical protein
METFIFLMPLAVLLAVMGKWGRANAPLLVPSGYAAKDREHRVAVLRRGALSCHVVAGMVAAVAVLALL